jgi:hypothetical protein
MHLLARPAVAAFAILLVACGGSGSSNPPSASTAPTGSATPPSPSASPSASADPLAAAPWLRATTTQALPPVNVFAIQPYAVVTADGRWITQGPVPAIFPGPLMPNLRSRQVTEAGRTAILRSAKDLGLLGGTTDFNAGPPLMGGVNGRIELTVDGRRIVLTGNPAALMECVTTPCDPPPGSPAAFAQFWLRLGDLGSWIPKELGPDEAFDAPAYAILVGPAPEPDPSLPQPPMDWPLASSIALLGGPVNGGAYRCGTVSGADAATLLPALRKANGLTPWVQDPGASATFGLTVRPMLTGEDVCREIFGPA